MGRMGESVCQREPVAAGQYADRGAGLLGSEQKVIHVADHVPALATHRHRVAAATRQRVGQSLRRVEAVASLIEGNSRQVGAEPGCRPKLVRVRRSAG